MKPRINSFYLQIEDMLYYTIGQDPNVRIRRVQVRSEEEACICIEVRYYNQAQALKSIMPEYYEWGMQKIYVHVLCGDHSVTLSCSGNNNQRAVASSFCTALASNDFFVGVKLNEQGFLPIKSSIEVYIYPCLVPIRCGGDCYNEQSLVQVFAEVLKREFGLIIRTEVLIRSNAIRKGRKECLYCVGNQRR
ncbi:MAG: hypothetical protein RR448_03510 [Niameybacter sp.]|uniref:hypothetical protein n=1 Tax=Niameybacter sp. TaxID=2033640 RepID=UPI002FCAD383